VSIDLAENTQDLRERRYEALAYAYERSLGILAEVLS
jgi:hypothetical protein